MLSRAVVARAVAGPAVAQVRCGGSFVDNDYPHPKEAPKGTFVPKKTSAEVPRPFSSFPSFLTQLTRAWAGGVGTAGEAGVPADGGDGGGDDPEAGTLRRPRPRHLPPPPHPRRQLRPHPVPTGCPLPRLRLHRRPTPHHPGSPPILPFPSPSPHWASPALRTPTKPATSTPRSGRSSGRACTGRGWRCWACTRPRAPSTSSSRSRAPPGTSTSSAPLRSPLLVPWAGSETGGKEKGPR